VSGFWVSRGEREGGGASKEGKKAFSHDCNVRPREEDGK
jgi:hypothetical protein